MNEALDNPVYHALWTGDTHLASGTDNVKYFDEEISPFAGFDEVYRSGFDDLHDLLPAGRKVLYATRKKIREPNKWELLHEIEGLQFVYEREPDTYSNDKNLISLCKQHAEEMVQLAALTKPGPFNLRTIEFGNYFGVFQDDRLVAMAGQRLHAGNYSEISAVCTHPEYLGRGFAAALIGHQLCLIRDQHKIPFLHVRADNSRAIALYERLGFKKNGPMNFYVLNRS